MNLRSLYLVYRYRTATADDTNTIFLISAHKEKNIVTVEGLGKEEKLISLAALVVGRTGERRSNTSGHA